MDIEHTLGPERISWLVHQTGMSRSELLTRLSRELPRVIDRLAPQPRLPGEEPQRIA
jgi:uncharacterized protein YidB (DUF937 family)